MTPDAYWGTLSAEDRAMVIRLCLPSMRKAPALLALRYEARQADLRNREILGPHARHIEFAHEQYKKGRLTEW